MARILTWTRVHSVGSQTWALPGVHIGETCYMHDNFLSMKLSKHLLNIPFHAYATKIKHCTFWQVLTLSRVRVLMILWHSNGYWTKLFNILETLQYQLNGFKDLSCAEEQLNLT